jgi:hypothetical protein
MIKLKFKPPCPCMIRLTSAGRAVAKIAIHSLDRNNHRARFQFFPTDDKITKKVQTTSVNMEPTV